MKIEIKTDNVGLLIGMLEILKNKDYLGQTILGPNESLDLILDLKEKKILRLTISKRLNSSIGNYSERDQRSISISDTNRSVLSDVEIVLVYDYGQKFVSSIKSIEEAVKNKLAEIKKGIENSIG
ncbi:MAG: hypothetical protein UT80_C0001G0006 [Parcubacteria group bacterium GW2011_GWC1_40_13]|nr:MAG: hypothetical protein UT80_C0001G0006 [Parcubacteria group bacterium GW2011_GWC1_40_13]